MEQAPKSLTKTAQSNALKKKRAACLLYVTGLLLFLPALAHAQGAPRRSI
jgi:hypothetical protein